MVRALDVEDFLAQSKNHLTLDVRSEGEYEYGHILHAENLPLFNNAERAQVGTTYKQRGKNEAVLEGLDIVGPKMGGFIRTVQPLVKENKVFVHCWRGGMRSGSMAWLLSMYGFEVYTLKGGYKNYRHYVQHVISLPRNYIVLGGKTGSGKTRVLHRLHEMGEQVIDLEKLASHKGSAFGMLGQPKQPTTEHFENMLAAELLSMNGDKAIWLEDESLRIGTVALHLQFRAHMRKAPLLVLDIPQEERVKLLVEEYAQHPIEALEKSLLNIQKRLGHEQWKEAMRHLHEKNFAEVARIALHYYDKTYSYGLTVKEAEEIQTLQFDTTDANTTASALLQAKNHLKRFI